VGKAVLELVDGRLFDNHVAIQFARSIYDFGHPSFWPLVWETRYAALRSATRSGEPLLLTTMCFAFPDDLDYVEQYEQAIGAGAEILPVFLTCAMAELETRISSPDRTATGKIDSIAMLRQYLREAPMTAIPRPNCLTIDTTDTPPAHAARAIVEHFHLADLPPSPSRMAEAQYRYAIEEIERSQLASVAGRSDIPLDGGKSRSVT
ncbi:hypothetical protein ACVIF9_001144, partial [Bradyrhizobium sp. USDA 4350]